MFSIWHNRIATARLGVSLAIMPKRMQPASKQLSKGKRLGVNLGSRGQVWY